MTGVPHTRDRDFTMALLRAYAKHPDKMWWAYFCPEGETLQELIDKINEDYAR